jgi:3-oxoadipate enol-lactonase
MRISEKSIETGGVRMTWLEAGAGWPLLLLHAFPLTAEMWRPQLERVPDGWRFIAPDLRGFGRARSLQPSGGLSGLTMDDYARDVGVLMDALGIDNATIGGLSMGGYVAFALFRQQPVLFTGLILADTRPQADSAQGREARARMRESLASTGPSVVADQMLPKLLSERTLRERPDLVARTRAMIESNAPDAIDAGIFAMMNRPDSTPDLDRVACATLIIAGEHDQVTPVSDAEAMQRAISRSMLTVIPDAAHLSNLEQPAVFSTALADFIAGHL